ncbi:MAG: hypothetical protein A4E28_02979 [Methanocella sp. PtaU1.Bin125]|nr:MAG: hypothetical protein A4E28_02979 [Methanocella sp. PtaU1.Bin125]
MSTVTKAIKYGAGIAALGVTVYGLSRMLKRKGETSQMETESYPAETGQAEMDRYLTEPREPGDYRSIYNL